MMGEDSSMRRVRLSVIHCIVLYYMLSHLRLKCSLRA
jgi:hypothetical protein